MSLKRPASCFLLGMLCSVSGMGCAAFDALVSGPPAGQHRQPPAERLAAIARVFENQGDLTKAESMYRMSMRQDPSNEFARERVEYIASLGQNRSFQARPTMQAIAVADSIPVRQRVPSGARAPNAASLAADAKTALLGGSAPLNNRAAVAMSTASRVRMDSLPPQHTAQVVTPTAGKVNYNYDGSQPARMPAARNHHTVITLDAVEQWMASPSENRIQLVSALQSGEDSGVQALAAALLADSEGDTEQINVALRSACDGPDSLVRVTARDALIRRGELNRDGVRDLLSLLADNDAEVRSQAAASFRNCVGSEWTNDCVSGLADLLHDLNPSVRAMAAATLGDFVEFNETTDAVRQLLQDARSAEDNENVLKAIDVSLDRRVSASTGKTTLRPLPPVE